jgi:hypothetical protein
LRRGEIGRGCPELKGYQLGDDVSKGRRWRGQRKRPSGWVPGNSMSARRPYGTGAFMGARFPAINRWANHRCAYGDPKELLGSLKCIGLDSGTSPYGTEEIMGRKLPWRWSAGPTNGAPTARFGGIVQAFLSGFEASPMGASSALTDAARTAGLRGVVEARLPEPEASPACSRRVRYSRWRLKHLRAYRARGARSFLCRLPRSAYQIIKAIAATMHRGDAPGPARPFESAAVTVARGRFE